MDCIIYKLSKNDVKSNPHQLCMTEILGGQQSLEELLNDLNEDQVIVILPKDTENMWDRVAKEREYVYCSGGPLAYAYQQLMNPECNM